MKKLKIGIFGLYRGMEYVRQFSNRPDTVVSAVCDRDSERVKDAVRICGEEVKTCGSFEELLSEDIDAVYIANYFPEHAQAAIQAMERGKDVLSECTSAVTLKDCVLLWETVERTGRKYMLAENEPFAKQNLELKRMYEGGTLGKLLYAEAEYNHYLDAESKDYDPELIPSSHHWRNFIPRTYYLTHTLGPLMFMTGEWPKTVSGVAVHSDKTELFPVKDAFASMNCMTDKGALYRFTGWTSMPGGYGFRLMGEDGLAETGRGIGPKVSVIYKDYTVPANMHQKCIYEPSWPVTDEPVNDGAHGGADWWVAKAFADYVLRGVQPFFDYRCGITMSLVAIFGWKSIMQNGATLEIPDFTRKEIRNLYRDNDDSPFPDEEGKVGFPCSTWQFRK